MGIECDGATYHSAKSARDRDRLRQEVLEGLGWRIRRIWSTDWFSNPQGEIDPILRELHELKSVPEEVTNEGFGHEGGVEVILIHLTGTQNLYSPHPLVMEIGSAIIRNSSWDPEDLAAGSLTSHDKEDVARR